MNLFIAVTLYDKKIHGECSESLLKNCVALMQEGHRVAVHYNNDLYIDHARNFCAKLFLESDCSDLIFVDADLGFDSDAILKLIKYDKDIVAGSYRYKKPDEEYPAILDFSRNLNCKDEETGLVYATLAPTGLMRIKRSVFDRMQKHYDIQRSSTGMLQFFDTGMRCGDGHWYGEDSYFCKRWREMGGEIMVEPNITFTHIGQHGFKGNYHEYLLGRRVDLYDNVDSGLQGWMTEAELNVLGLLASKVKDVVEVGSWKGRSTQKFLESCSGTVYAVDHWLGSVTDISGRYAKLADIKAEFMQNVGHYPNLQVMEGYSVEVARTFNRKVDMVFIDAGHTYEDVKSDLEAWLPYCGKIIAGHDYHINGVKCAVDEKFPKVNTVESVWWVELGN